MLKKLRIKQKNEAREILKEIEKKTSHEEAEYYKKQLIPASNRFKYNYETYVKLLDEVRRQVNAGFRERNEPKVIVATARIKVLT